MEPKTTPRKILPQRQKRGINDKPSQFWKGEKLLATIGLLLVFFVGLYVLPGIQDRKAASSKGAKVADTHSPNADSEPNRGNEQFSGVVRDSGDTDRNNNQLPGDTETQVTPRDWDRSIKNSEPIARSKDDLPPEKDQTATTSTSQEKPDDMAAVKDQTLKADVTPKPVEPSAPMSGRPAQSTDSAKFTFYFRFNSTEILDLLGKRRAGALEFVGECKGAIEIVGHACNIGPSDINLAIGLGRAGAVKDLLARAGTDADRFNVRSEGEERPAASNQTPTGRAQNRRVEILCSKRDIGKNENNDLN